MADVIVERLALMKPPRPTAVKPPATEKTTSQSPAEDDAATGARTLRHETFSDAVRNGGHPEDIDKTHSSFLVGTPHQETTNN